MFKQFHYLANTIMVADMSNPMIYKRVTIIVGIAFSKKMSRTIAVGISHIIVMMMIFFVEIIS